MNASVLEKKVPLLRPTRLNRKKEEKKSERIFFSRLNVKMMQTYLFIIVKLTAKAIVHSMKVSV